MEIIKHKMELRASSSSNNYLWKVVVKHKGELYEIQIEANSIASDKEYYYTGYIKNTDSIKAYFADSWLSFGFSNYVNTYTYILRAMRKVIAGDYSSIKGVGHCIDKP